MPQASPTRRSLRPPSETFSGLYVLPKETRARAAVALAHFDACMEIFVELWTLRMQAAGYLPGSTALHDDCVAACRAFVTSILAHARQRTTPTFETLRSNEDGWATPLVEAGLRHWRRGVAPERFTGCFKTFLMALEDALAVLPRLSAKVGEDAAAAAVQFVRLHAHVFETLWVGAVHEGASYGASASAAKKEGTPIAQTPRFESLFESTSDGALLLDAHCGVVAANAAARRLSGGAALTGPVWKALGLGKLDRARFLDLHPLGQPVVQPLFDGRGPFRVTVTSPGCTDATRAGEFIVLFAEADESSPRDMEAARTDILDEERARLEELGLTLRTVLADVNDARGRHRSGLASHVRRVLLPALERLAEEGDESKRRAAVETLRTNLLDVLAGDTRDPAGESLGRLTLAELKVCRLVREGHKSKEIAGLLNISFETVQTHRRNIRRKLGLRGRDRRLAAVSPGNGDAKTGS